EHTKTKMIKYKEGLLYSACAIPAILIGIYITDRLSLAWFKIIFGIIIIPISAFCFIRSYKEIATMDKPNNFLGMITSFFISIFASTIGVGGGILYGPAFAYFLKFDKLMAKATSMFIVGITSFVIIIIRTKQGVLPFGLVGYLLLALAFITLGMLSSRFLERLLSKHLHCHCILNKKQVCGLCLTKYLFSGIFGVLVSYMLFVLSNIAKAKPFVNGEYGKIFLITLLLTVGGTQSSKFGNSLSIKFGGSWVMRILAILLGLVGILTIYRGWSGIIGY
ncbi:MAG: TSUP family transporter, partial [Candidatus Poribacteria bacterium]